MNGYKVERLPNGFVRVDDRASGLVCMYERDDSSYIGPAAKLHSGPNLALPLDVRAKIASLLGTENV